MCLGARRDLRGLLLEAGDPLVQGRDRLALGLPVGAA